MPAPDRSGLAAAAFLGLRIGFGLAYKVWRENAFWIQLTAEFLNLKFGTRSNNHPDMAAPHQAKATTQYQMCLSQIDAENDIGDNKQPPMHRKGSPVNEKCCQQHFPKSVLNCPEGRENKRNGRQSRIQNRTVTENVAKHLEGHIFFVRDRNYIRCRSEHKKG